MFKPIYIFAPIYILLFVAFTQCKTKTSLLDNSNFSFFSELAVEKFGTDTLLSFSPNLKYILCQKKQDLNVPNPNVLTEFFIYDLTGQKIILEKKMSNSSISWKNNEELIVKKHLGIKTNTNDPGIKLYKLNILENIITPYVSTNKLNN